MLRKAGRLAKCDLKVPGASDTLAPVAVDDPTIATAVPVTVRPYRRLSSPTIKKESLTTRLGLRIHLAAQVNEEESMAEIIESKEHPEERQYSIEQSGQRSDYLDNISIDRSGKKISFTYHLSNDPTYQSVVVYEGSMPSFKNYNDYKLLDEWIKDHSVGRDSSITLNLNKKVNSGTICTIALFKGTTNDTKWDLGDFQTVYG